MAIDPAIGERDVLLVVDVQNDFCPGGALAVPQGDQVVSLINRLAQRFFACDPDAGLAPARPRVVCLDASGQTTLRSDSARLWPASAVARSLHPGKSRGGVSRKPAYSTRRARAPKGLPPGNRFVFRFLRERPQNPDRAERLSARARSCSASYSPVWRSISASAIPPRTPVARGLGSWSSRTLAAALTSMVPWRKPTGVSHAPGSKL